MTLQERVTVGRNINEGGYGDKVVVDIGNCLGLAWLFV